MDWKNNIWTGVIAVAVVIAGAAGLYFYVTRTGSAAVALDSLPPWKFQCETTGEIIKVSMRELDDSAETYERYRVDYGTPADCPVCGNKDAYRVYFCARCNKYFKYQAGEEASSSIKCLDGHPIDGNDI